MRRSWSGLYHFTMARKAVIHRIAVNFVFGTPHSARQTGPVHCRSATSAKSLAHFRACGKKKDGPFSQILTYAPSNETR